MPYELENGLKIKINAFPTLTDGKVKVMWSEWEKKAMTKCVICGAGPKAMANKHGKFKPNKKHYNFGLACLHIRICAFLWCCKIYLYQDIRRYSKRKGEAYLVKQRMEELRYKMKNCKELELDVFKVVPGKG